MKLIIGNKNYSSWSLRPWLLLSHHRLMFDEIRVPLFTPGYKGELLEHSGTGLVPVLIDGPVTVWDSLAICEYVSEKYLGGAGWPQGINIRAQARACSAEMHSGFHHIRNELPMNARATGRRVEITPQLQKEIDRVDSMWNIQLETQSTPGPWLFGDFCIADCMYAPLVFRFNTYGITLSDRAARYADFVLNSPSMQSWLAAARAEPETIDFAEIGM